MKKNIFPKALKKGAKIAVISPAGAVDDSQLQTGIKMIKSKGFQPVLGEHLYARYSNGYNYAGTEKERIKKREKSLDENRVSASFRPSQLSSANAQQHELLEHATATSTRTSRIRFGFYSTQLRTNMLS